MFYVSGVCSAINGAICGTAIAAIEVQIAETEATLNRMRNYISKMSVRIHDLKLHFQIFSRRRKDPWSNSEFYLFIFP